MKKFFFFYCLSFLMANFAFSQNINIEEEYFVSEMLQRHVQNNKANTMTSGWRVQIFSTSDRNKVEEAKQNFLRDYPGVRVDWTHAKPYYRLRAGAFTTKLEAMKLLHQLKRDYPSAFPAKDNNISFREIVGI